jgi:hypothetical protein
MSGARAPPAARHNPAVLDADALLAGARRPLVLGVGGGGDVVGALALAEPLRRVHGAHPVVGGVSWERIPIDRHPGPRAVAEIDRAVAELAPNVRLAGPQTGVRTGGGEAPSVRFAEARVAELTGEHTVLVDPAGGAARVADGLGAAIEALDADLLLLVDVGGDALAHGDEPGLASPLCDAVLLAAGAELADRGTAVLGAVLGPGCDGELSLKEVLDRIAELAHAGGVAGARWLTGPAAELLERAVEHVPTEASAQPLRAFRGETGVATIRRGRRAVELSPLGALTVFFDVQVALETAARLARAVREADSLDAANELLHRLGVRTELDYERARLLD